MRYLCSCDPLEDFTVHDGVYQLESFHVKGESQLSARVASKARGYHEQVTHSQFRDIRRHFSEVLLHLRFDSHSKAIKKN